MKSVADLRQDVAEPITAGTDTQLAASACAGPFREETRRLFVDVAQQGIIAAGVKPAPRPVFRKLHGIAHGSLRLHSDLPDRFRHGLLAQSSYAAWVRFSSDTRPQTPDRENSTLGIAIKLFGVTGATLDEDDPDAGTCDLLLQNHDRFFVDNGQDFCEFSHAAVLGDFDAYIAAHPETKVVLDEMAKPEASALGATYWSVLPYACGPEVAVKYRLAPLGAPAGGTLPVEDPDYLKADLARRLASGAASFEFAVQPFTSDTETPLDKAMKRWPTPFLPIGVLTLDRQVVGAPGQAAYGENLSFHPWRVPPSNQPLGSIADARRITYRSSAHLRRTVNGVPAVEPRRAR
jgi:hypothetical protein